MLQTRGELRVLGEVDTSLGAPTSQGLGQPKPGGAAPIASPPDDVMLALRSSAGKGETGWPERVLCLLPPPLSARGSAEGPTATSGSDQEHGALRKDTRKLDRAGHAYRVVPAFFPPAPLV